jgi:hypothetical protein
LILILAGVVLLVQNLKLVPVHMNWWALFVFIPVVGSLTTAWTAFQKNGKFNAAVRGALGSALVIGTVATILLLGLNWGHWWPLMVIAAGGFADVDARKHKNVAAWMGFNLWVGLAAMLLGVGFLAVYLPIDAINTYLTGFPRWWSVPILFAGLGAFVNAFVVCLRNQFRPNWTVWAFTTIGIAISATGLFALFNLQWGLLAPIILIAAGVIFLSGILIKK